MIKELRPFDGPANKYNGVYNYFIIILLSYLQQSFFASNQIIISLRDFVHSGYCDPQRRRLLLLLLLALALALALASSQIVSPPKI